MATCKIKDCNNKVCGRGLCSKHYAKWAKYGNPTEIRQEQKHGLTLKERFFAHVTVGITKGSCWEWTSFRDPNGYGRINIKNKPVLAHRLSWEIHKDNIPKGLCVLHGCDNPGCVSPRHLFLGTQKDNVADCIRKGRDNYGLVLGEKHGCSKLTEKDVLAIRSSEETGVILAKRYGVSTATISDVRKGHIWKHLPLVQNDKTREPFAKRMTKENVLEIRKSNEATSVLAKTYNVHKSSIQNVRNRKTWKHI